MLVALHQGRVIGFTVSFTWEPN